MSSNQLVVTRLVSNDRFALGMLTHQGRFVCYTCEDAIRTLRTAADKVAGKTAISAGTYKLRLSMSNRFKRELPELLDVPYFKGIRIHSGNGANDSEGCILVGDRIDWVTGVITGGRVRGVEKALIELIAQKGITEIKVTQSL